MRFTSQVQKRREENGPRPSATSLGVSPRFPLPPRRANRIEQTILELAHAFDLLLSSASLRLGGESC